MKTFIIIHSLLLILLSIWLLYKHKDDSYNSFEDFTVMMGLVFGIIGLLFYTFMYLRG